MSFRLSGGRMGAKYAAGLNLLWIKWMRTERNKPRGCSSLLSLSDLTQTTLGRIINNYRVSLMLTSPHWSAKRFSFSLLLSETNIFILLRCFSIFTVDIRQSAGIDSQAVAVCSFPELKWWNCVVANAVCVHLICTKFVVSFVYIITSFGVLFDINSTSD